MDAISNLDRLFEEHDHELQEALVFRNSLLQRHDDPKTIWFVNVLTALLLGLIREYEQLNIGYKQSARLLAWACRNLMEISVYTEYALMSEKNAHELIDDVVLDSLDIFDSFKKWFTALEPGLQTPDLDTALGLFREAKEDLGVARNKYRSTLDLARILKREADYGHANKICSKLIHPTALSLLSGDIDQSDRDDVMRPYLYWAGAKYFAESLTHIRQHVGKHGTKPSLTEG